MRNNTIRNGNIYRVEFPYDNETVERLVIVANVNESGNVQICPIHTYPEYAVGSDHVVSSPIVRFPVVIETGIRGVLRRTDLRELVAHLPISGITTGGKLRLDDASLTVYSGMEMRGQFDARYEFRVNEMRMFQEMCREATASILGEW